MEKHREKTGLQTMTEMRSALYEKLFFGFNNVTTAMKNIEVQQVSRTINLTVSTRSLGFMIRTLFVKFTQLSVLQPLDVPIIMNALYRISLYSIEIKMEEAMSLQHSRNLELNRFEESFVPSDIKRAICGMGANFAPLVNYISAIGFFKTAYAAYLPRHAKVNNCCDPLHIRIGNLRRLVILLSSRDVNRADARRYFADHNPIPGAIWHRTNIRRTARKEEIPPNVWLSNPDEIIPQVYGIAEVRNDLTLIASTIERVGRKYPKYVSTGGIDYKSLGSTCQLVSSKIADIKILGLERGYTTIVGEHDNFWTPVQLSDPEFYMGVIYLLGERSSMSYKINFTAGSSHHYPPSYYLLVLQQSEPAD